MPTVAVSEHFGMLIRKDALIMQGIVRNDLLAIMETDEPYDESDDLISFGPHFGGEAVHEFIRRLEAAGLKYGSHFIDIELVLPDWVQLHAVMR